MSSSIFDFVKELLATKASKKRKLTINKETTLPWRVRFVLTMTMKDCPCCGATKMFPCGGDLDDNIVICTGRLLSSAELEEVLNTGKLEN
jgi:hypothetical protein